MKNENYAIAAIKEFYGPEQKIVFERDERGDIESFDAEEATERLEELEDADYHLCHGEACRPSYYILSADDAEYINTGRRGDGGDYDWNDSRCGYGHCGECPTCIDYMLEQDVQYIIDNSITYDQLLRNIMKDVAVNVCRA